MQFRRIKLVPGVRVDLEWSKERADGHESKVTTLSSTDAPLPSFVDALQAFKRFVLKILEIDDTTYGDTLIVQSVSLNEEQDGRRGIVITSLKSLTATQAPAVLNTPHLREDVDGAGEKGFMLRGMMDHIEQLEAEAERYYKGERAQRDMFVKDETPKVESRGTVEFSAPGYRSGKIPLEVLDQAVDRIAGGRRARRNA